MYGYLGQRRRSRHLDWTDRTHRTAWSLPSAPVEKDKMKERSVQIMDKMKSSNYGWMDGYLGEQTRIGWMENNGWTARAH